ncbi:MAG: hypothetical protein WD060_05290 [Pirellulales bacterium]
MIRSLRILLIVAAAFSTVLVGLQAAFAEVRSAALGVSAVDGDNLDGSREDDSGTRSEQVEEDDSEEREGRELHLFATTSLACRLDALGHLTLPPMPCQPAQSRGQAVLVRGPPAAI